MAYRDACIALDLISNDFLSKHPERAVLFLMMTYYDYITYEQLKSLTWKNIDLEEGILHIDPTLSLMLPDLIHELFEETYKKLKPGSLNNKLISNFKPEYIESFQEAFEEYRAEVDFSGKRNRRGKYAVR